MYQGDPIFNALLILAWILIVGLPVLIALAIIKGFWKGWRG